MTWIITRLCQDCVDTDCVSVCPVDCIYCYTGTDHKKFPNQLYINPDDCIDCAACEPACPWEAIFEDCAVPKLLAADTPLNYEIMKYPKDFAVQENIHKPKPAPDEIKANKKKHGLSP